MVEEQVELKYLHLNKENPWVCPRCGSRHTVCHAGMFVDRFECLDCHWDWR